MKKLESTFKNLEIKYKKHKDKSEIIWPEHVETWNRFINWTKDDYENQEVPIHSYNNTKGVGRIYNQTPHVIDKISELMNQKEIDSNNLCILDICCGSPFLLKEIKKTWPKCKTYGIDTFTTEFDDFNENVKGSKVYKFSFQMLLKLENIFHDSNIDIVIMINSYRGFDKDLQENINDWCKVNSKYLMYDEGTIYCNIKKKRVPAIRIKTKKDF